MQVIIQAKGIQQKLDHLLSQPVLKWSVLTSGLVGMMALTGVFSIWMVIEILAMLTDIAAA